MAQNITLLGASYQDVPAVELPKTGGGTARFDDASITTAVAADVAQGKQFLLADGSIGTGTASGGGGGASNFVQGTFTTGSTSGVTNINIPYTGSGYPISCIVVVDGGAFKSGTDWYNSTQRYAVGQWTMTKSDFSSTPTYGTSGTENRGVVASIYKNSSSSATTYSRTSSMSMSVYTSSDPSNSATAVINIKPNNVLSYYVHTSSFGLLPDTTYRYIITYSS